MNDKDIYFKNKFDTTKFEDDIYTQLAKNMAKAVDIDFAKTPVIDILTGYINYIELQSNWNSLREYYKRKAEETKDSTALYDKWTKYSSVLNKMNELESGDNK